MEANNSTHTVFFSIIFVEFLLLNDVPVSPFFKDPSNPIDFRDLRAVMILSYKYDAVQVQDEAHRRLGVCYPCMLEEWDERYPQSCSNGRFGNKPNATEEDTLSVLPID